MTAHDEAPAPRCRTSTSARSKAIARRDPQQGNRNAPGLDDDGMPNDRGGDRARTSLGANLDETRRRTERQPVPGGVGRSSPASSGTCRTRPGIARSRSFL